MEGLKDEITIIFRHISISMIFITMPAARQYTKQITLHENETIHYIYTIYTLYKNVI